MAAANRATRCPPSSRRATSSSLSCFEPPRTCSGPDIPRRKDPAGGGGGGGMCSSDSLTTQPASTAAEGLRASPGDDVPHRAPSKPARLARAPACCGAARPPVQPAGQTKDPGLQGHLDPPQTTMALYTFTRLPQQSHLGPTPYMTSHPPTCTLCSPPLSCSALLWCSAPFQLPPARVPLWPPAAASTRSPARTPGAAGYSSYLHRMKKMEEQGRRRAGLGLRCHALVVMSPGSPTSCHALGRRIRGTRVCCSRLLVLTSVNTCFKVCSHSAGDVLLNCRRVERQGAGSGDLHSAGMGREGQRRRNEMGLAVPHCGLLNCASQHTELSTLRLE